MLDVSLSARSVSPPARALMTETLDARAVRRLETVAKTIARVHTQLSFAALQTLSPACTLDFSLFGGIRFAGF